MIGRSYAVSCEIEQAVKPRKLHARIRRLSRLNRRRPHLDRANRDTEIYRRQVCQNADGSGVQVQIVIRWSR